MRELVANAIRDGLNEQEPLHFRNWVSDRSLDWVAIEGKYNLLQLADFVLAALTTNQEWPPR